MTFDREPDLDNANVGTPIICIIRGSYLRNQVASALFLQKIRRNNGI